MPVRAAKQADVDAMVALSERFRRRLAEFSPVFWRPAPDASLKQAAFFRFSLSRADWFALLHEPAASAAPDGFVLCHMVAAPPVYAPGAPVCLIDDFCAEPADAWPRVGGALLDAAVVEGRRRGAPLTSIVAAHLDAPKRALLAARGFVITSEWHVRENV